MNNQTIREGKPIKGRGALSNVTGRYQETTVTAFDDGWEHTEYESKPQTHVHTDATRSVLVYNKSPDLPFDRSINPYRGCEHGCIYCFARPSHAYLGLSPGIDFEIKLFRKPNAAEILSRELSKPGYQCKPLALGVNTDAYQPIERKERITRSILEVLRTFRHPVSIITKSALIERDIDILTDMAADDLVSVCVSVTTLDKTIARTLEPRAAGPHRRLQTIERLSEAGIPVTTLVAPVIPVLTDPELDKIVSAVATAGATNAEYILLRLPLEISDLFQEWLHAHFPLKAEHVMTRVRDTRGGKNYDSRFGHRMSGTGEYAEIIAQRFSLACKKNNLRRREWNLNTSLFTVPIMPGEQFSLF